MKDEFERAILAANLELSEQKKQINEYRSKFDASLSNFDCLKKCSGNSKWKKLKNNFQVLSLTKKKQKISTEPQVRRSELSSALSKIKKQSSSRS
jgi:hypothetical protein